MDQHEFSVILYLILILASILITFGVGFHTIRRRKVHGTRSFAIALFLESAWAIGYFFEIIQPGLAGKIFWDNLQWIPIFLLPLAYLSFAYEYTFKKFARPARVWIALAIVPFLATLLVFTNPLHGLAATSIQLIPGKPFDDYTYNMGALLWAAVIYDYVITILSILILISHTLRHQGIYRIQTWIIILGIVVPMLGAIFSLFSQNFGQHHDLSPVTFIIANLLIAFGLFRYRLFDVFPFARDLVMENMEDGVIILDGLNRLVDINTAAKTMLESVENIPIGQPMVDLLSGLLKQIGLDQTEPAVRKEIILGQAGETRTIDLRITRLINQNSDFSGHMIILRDVSDRKHAETILQQTYGEMELHVAERTTELSDSIARLEEEITERKEVEKALQNSEAKYRTVLEQSTDAFLLIDTAGKIIEVNQAYEELTGQKRENIINRLAWDVVYDELLVPEHKTLAQREFFKNICLQALQTGESPYFNHPTNGVVNRPDGSRHYIQQHLFLVRTDLGNRIGYVTRDVTEVKLAAEEANKQARNLNEVNNLAVELVGVTSEAHLYQLISEKIQSVTGALGVVFSIYNPEEQCLHVESIAAESSFLNQVQKILPEQITKMHIPLSPENKQAMLDEFIGMRSSISQMALNAFPEYLGDIIQSTFKIGECWRITFKGEGELLGTLAVYLPIGAPSPSIELLKAFSHVVSVTLQRKRAEQALRDNEERFRALLENSNDLISLLDEKGSLKFEINTGSRERILGYLPGTLMKKRLLDLIHPADILKARSAFARLAQNPNSEDMMELRYLRADGNYIYLETFAKNLLDNPFVKGIVVTSHDITERKHAEREQRRLNRTLTMISECNKALIRMDDEAALLQAICKIMVEIGDYRFTCIGYIQSAADQGISPVTSYGEGSDCMGMDAGSNAGPETQLLSNYIRSRVKSAQPIMIGDIRTDPIFSPYRDEFIRQGFFSVSIFPLKFGTQLFGSLNIYADEPHLADPNELGLLTEMVNDVSFGIHARRMHIDRDHAEHEVHTANAELNHAYESTLEGWSRALELRERETAGHSQRVVALTLAIATKMGISKEDLVHLRRGALLHDIGKMGIPDHILLKPAPLTAEEWVIMRQHPQFAYQLLCNIPYLAPALEIPYSHHEHWDGSGYPQQLKGTAIPMTARIFTVVDVWDALTSNRPYRPAWTKEVACSYLKSQAGIQFDPHVVDVFLDLIAQNPDALA